MTGPLDRRGAIGRIVAGTVAAATPAAVSAGTAKDTPPGTADLLDRLAVGELVERERTARDAGLWEEMGACWHPQSSVSVSWFKGDGAGFVAASRRVLSEDRLSQHQLGPTVARVADTRATAETQCQLLTFVAVDGIDVCLVGTTRLVWRARRTDGGWLLAGLRMIYVRDLLLPCLPGAFPKVDVEELSRHRRSYRFLSYILARSANPPRADLPGTDRPPSVAALRAAEAAWLRTGVESAG